MKRPKQESGKREINYMLALRLRAGLTQVQMAARLGCTPRSVGGYEQTGRMPTSYIVVSNMRELECELEAAGK